MHIEQAKKKDARDLAYLINLAGEGIPEFLWSANVEANESPLDVGERRAAREEGGFSYKNARVIRDDDLVTGMIMAYRLDDPYEVGNIEDYPEVVRPLILLESEAPGSWYVNAIATKEEYRGKGIARHLLQEAEENAKAQGVNIMSLIVASENTNARDLYIRIGYQPVSSLPLAIYPGMLHGGDWELMVKSI